MSVLLMLPVGSVVYAFWQSDWMGKVIVIGLLVGSVLAWTMMIVKVRELKSGRNLTDRFLSAYGRESHPVALFLKRSRFDGSPAYRIYDEVCKALGAALEARGADADDLFMGGVGTSRMVLGKNRIAMIRNVAERKLATEELLLEKGMVYLATAVTAAPFLGLFGTVWGVMGAFGGMAVKGAAMLSAVAPGISGALLTTVVGLLVALPSSVGYNVLVTAIRHLNVQMGNFLEQLLSDIELHYLAEE